MEGRYVVFEGHDGTGKSTQARLLHQHLQEAGTKSRLVAEPGGTELGLQLRMIILTGGIDRDAETNLLMFSAARRELWRQVIEPALEAGETVVSDRNYISSLAYQCYGEGLSPDLVLETTANFVGERYMQPDFSFVLAVNSLANARQRINDRGLDTANDTFEAKDDDYQDRVREGYLTIADDLSVPVINASRERKAVFEDILGKISI